MKLKKKVGLYLFWLKKKIGINTVDFVKSCGYFHPHTARVGNITLMKSNNGKKLIYKIVYLEFYRDPWDMIKTCNYSLIGIEGEKKIKECSFKEFLKIYNPKLV